MIVRLYCIRNVDAVHKHIEQRQQQFQPANIYIQGIETVHSHTLLKTFSSSRRQFCRYILWFKIAKNAMFAF